jgi:hypothetical protein
MTKGLPSLTYVLSSTNSTAASSTARADQGAPASVSVSVLVVSLSDPQLNCSNQVGGVTYKDGTCAASGSFKTETTTITGGTATFTLAAAEALLVTFP